MSHSRRPLHLSDRVVTSQTGKTLTESQEARPSVDSVGRIEDASEPILAAGQEPALEVGVNVESVYLARILLNMYVFQWLRIASADARDVVGEDSAVCACGKDHGIAVPFDVADVQLVGCCRLDRRRLGCDGGSDVGPVAEVEIEARRVVDDYRLEDVRAGEGDGAPVGGDIEARDRHAGNVDGVLGLGRSVCRRARGRRGGRDRVTRRIWRGLGAEELAHDAGLASIHGAGSAATATPSAARLNARVAFLV